MEWLTLIKAALSVGLEAYRAGKIMVREKEAIDGRAVVAKMHARYAESREDSGLPPGARGG